MPVGPQRVEACARDDDDHTSSLKQLHAAYPKSKSHQASGLRSTSWTDCCDLSAGELSLIRAGKQAANMPTSGLCLETRLEGHPRRHCCKALSRYPGLTH